LPKNEKKKLELMPICEFLKKFYNLGYFQRKTNVD